MNWFKRANIRKAQASSGGVLLSAIRGEMDEFQAIRTLVQLNDPETCNNVAALIGDPAIQSSFPNSTQLLYTIGNELNCLSGTTNDFNSTEMPQPQSDDVM